MRKNRDVFIGCEYMVIEDMGNTNSWTEEFYMFKNAAIQMGTERSVVEWNIYYP